MKKAIIFIIIGLLAIFAVLGLYFSVFKKTVKLQSAIDTLQIPEIKVTSEEGIGSLELETFDLGSSLPANLFPNISVNTEMGGYKGEMDLGFSVSSVGLSSLLETVSGSGSAPAPETLEPTEDICAQFDIVPSCSMLPSQYQQYKSLCEQCKK